MKLNKDGTATLTVAGNHLHLPTPTWGQLKTLKRKALEMTNQLSEIGDSIRDNLTENQKELFETAVGMIRKGASNEATELLQNQNEEDLAAVSAAHDKLGSIRETSQELTAIWWSETVEALTGEKVDSDDLPGGLANEHSVNDYLAHVQSVPFDFSQ